MAVRFDFNCDMGDIAHGALDEKNSESPNQRAHEYKDENPNGHTRNQKAGLGPVR